MISVFIHSIEITFLFKLWYGIGAINSQNSAEKDFRRPPYLLCNHRLCFFFSQLPIWQHQRTRRLETIQLLLPFLHRNLMPNLTHISFHHSIIPTSNLVSTPLAGSSNYSSWSRAMIALCRKNKIDFVPKAIKKPTKGNLLSTWKCNNDIKVPWIINSISKEIVANLVYNGNVKEIWDQLKER